MIAASLVSDGVWRAEETAPTPRNEHAHVRYAVAGGVWFSSANRSRPCCLSRKSGPALAPHEIGQVCLLNDFYAFAGIGEM
jgi:hypothetical protein